MMGEIRAWLTSLVVVTMLVTVTQTLVPAGTIRKIASFTGGLILLAVLLRPVLGAELERVTLRLEDYQAEVEKRQEELAESEQETLAELIEERSAAYISDKADALGLTVAVRVRTKENSDGVPVPVEAELRGSYSEELASYIEDTLGIPRERQVWHERKN